MALGRISLVILLPFLTISLSSLRPRSLSLFLLIVKNYSQEYFTVYLAFFSFFPYYSPIAFHPPQEMLSISSLLNPESPSSEKPGSNKGAPPASSHSQPTTTRRPSTKPKRRRATKNTPEHSQAPPMPHILNEQEIRFPPHEVTSMEGRDACMKFSVMPEGNLGFPKHIPYSSTKAPRLQPARKTGFHGWLLPLLIFLVSPRGRKE